MKIQKTTVILMVSAVLLGGFVYLYEVQGSPKREQVKAQQQQLFRFKESDVEAMTLTTQKQKLKFERSTEKGSTWMLQVMEPASSTCATQTPKQTDNKSAVCEAPSAGQVLTSSPVPAANNSSPAPAANNSSPAPAVNNSSPAPAVNNNEKVPASDASVAYLLNLVTSAKFDRKITMADPLKQRQEYGLDAPLATVEMRLKNQQSHHLVLGKPDFNKSFLYAQIDPSADVSKALDVVLVPADFENAVDRPVSEWKKEESKPKSEEKPKDTKPTPKDKPTP